jgi:hypothetical protein
MRIFEANRLAYRIARGDMSQVRDGDHSRAVILLLNSLAYWTKGDAARMARMIRQTKIDQSKFDSLRGDGTWLDWQIADAVAYVRGEKSAPIFQSSRRSLCHHQTRSSAEA